MKKDKKWLFDPFFAIMAFRFVQCIKTHNSFNASINDGKHYNYKQINLGITIDVEDKEYQNFDQRLRCHGKIIEGEQDVGNYHSLILTAGDDFIIGKKMWMPHHERMFSKAKKASFRAVALNVETDTIVFAELRTFGLRELKTINRAGGGKRKGGEAQKSFFERGVEQPCRNRPRCELRRRVAAPGRGVRRRHRHPRKPRPLDRQAAIRLG